MFIVNGKFGHYRFFPDKPKKKQLCRLQYCISVRDSGFWVCVWVCMCVRLVYVKGCGGVGVMGESGRLCLVYQ